MPIPTRSQSSKTKIPTEQNGTSSTKTTIKHATQHSATTVTRQLSDLQHRRTNSNTVLTAKNSRDLPSSTTSGVPRPFPASGVPQRQTSALPKPKLPGPAVHARNRSIPTLASNHVRTRSDAQVSNVTVSKAQETKTARTAIARPQFTTYQQSYSPQKPNLFARPLSAEEALKPPATTASQSSPELMRLEDELLQLMLVHENSANTLVEYEASIEQTFGHRLQQLQNEKRFLIQLEQQKQQQVNILAIQEWSHNDLDCEGQTRIQTLSDCVRDIGVLIGDEAPLSLALNQFEEWVDKCRAIMKSRSDQSYNHEIEFLPRLDAQLSKAMLDAQKRLHLCAQTLQEFESPHPDSGLELIINKHKQLVATVLEEIELCRSLEAEIQQSEQVWINSSVNQALAEVEIYSSSSTRTVQRTGIWQSEKPQ